MQLRTLTQKALLKFRGRTPQLYFVHIPKTGGNSIRSALRRENLLTNPGYDKSEREHKWAREDAMRRIGAHRSFNSPTFPCYLHTPPFLTADIAFSVIRNPFDLLVSYYHHTGNVQKQENGWANVNSYHKFSTFDQFIDFFCNCDPQEWHVPALCENLYSQLVDKDGNYTVNYLIYFDSLEDNLNRFLSNIVKVPCVMLPKKHVSTRRSDDCQVLYNRRTRGQVERKCEKLLTTFQFDFGTRSQIPYRHSSTFGRL